jgi:serine/threonine-protein kinase
VARVVGSAYRLGELLGRGAMGEVYAAVGPSGEAVALKFLKPAAARSAELVDRFRREAKLAAAIASPHVTRVLGSGKDRDGRLWIAFERLRGETLEQRLMRRGRVPLAEAAWVVEHVLEGLRAAHAAGVVHRDVKPANVFLDDGVEHARILDFGVAKLFEGAPGADAATTTQEQPGTPVYMAPEQLARGGAVDPRTDLYSAAAVAFVSLTGALPFAGTTSGAILHHKLYRHALSLGEVTRFAWPEAIERWLARGLARERELRHSSATDALAEWRSACRVASALGWAPPEGAAPVSVTGTKPA